MTSPTSSASSGDASDASGNIQTYSQRTVLAYIGLEIFLAHPLTGVGWQASELPVNFEPHLDAARRRFPDVAEQALPSDEHRWGVQNAYVQAAADLGILGLARAARDARAALLRAAIRGIRGSAPAGTRSRSQSRSRSSSARPSGRRSASSRASPPPLSSGSSSAAQ